MTVLMLICQELGYCQAMNIVVAALLVYVDAQSQPSHMLMSATDTSAKNSASGFCRCCAIAWCQATIRKISF